MTGPIHRGTAEVVPLSEARSLDAPFVVLRGPTEPEPSRARLADVLVAAAGNQHGDRLCAALLTRYPGLSLAVVTQSSGWITASVRGGPAVTLRYIPAPAATSAALFDGVARHLYARWLAGSNLTELSGVRFAVSPWGAVELVELPGQVLSPE